MYRVLIADDDHLTLMILHDMLVNSGCAVTCANDGGEALDILKNEQQAFDIIILDMSMPNLSGPDTFFEIRKINDHLPVLLASGYEEENVSPELWEKGLAGFIEKPFNYKTLMAKINEILGSEGD